MKLLLHTSPSLVSKLTRIPWNQLSTTITRSESHLATLRKKTGYALSLCKEALTKNSNDVVAAERWLKEQAAKHGWAKVSKLQGRATAEGLIGVYVNEKSSLGVALEVNCETDFVARNDVFRNLIASITGKIASSDLVTSSILSSNPSLESLTKVKFNQEQLDPFKEHLVTSVSKLGENIILKQAVALSTTNKSSSNSIKLVGYAHSVGGQKNVLDGIYLGKYASILAYGDSPQEDLDYEKDWLAEMEDSNKRSRELKIARESERRKRAATAASEEGQDVHEDEDEFMDVDDASEEASLPRELIPKMLCQHIIGMKPSKLRYNEEELQHVRKLVQLRKSSGKPSDDDDDLESLLDQKFIINNQVVRQVLKQSGLRVVDFIRIECGQSDDAQ